MRKVTVDCCGMQCPGPIMEVYKNMNELSDGDLLEVSASDPGFAKDIASWCKRTGNTLVSNEQKNGAYVAVVRRGLGAEIAETAFDLFKRNYHWDMPLRGVGVRGSELVDTTNGVQLSLYADSIKREKWEKIDGAMDRLRHRYGYLSIQRAIVQTDPLLAAVDPSQHTIHPVGYFAG